MTGTAMKVNGTTFELNKIFSRRLITMLLKCVSEAVFAGYGIVDGTRDDYKDLKVAGKLCIKADGAPADYKPAQGTRIPPSSAFGKIDAAMNKGAAALWWLFTAVSPQGRRTE